MRLPLRSGRGVDVRGIGISLEKTDRFRAEEGEGLMASRRHGRGDQRLQLAHHGERELDDAVVHGVAGDLHAQDGVVSGVAVEPGGEAKGAGRGEGRAG